MRPALLALLVAAAPAFAQDATTPGAPGAEAVVDVYIEAFATRDYTAAVRELDPAEVAEFADLLEELALLAPENALDTKGEPAKVVAGFLEQMMDMAGPAGGILGEAMESLDAEILGTVLEGDSLAHVVARSSFAMMGGSVARVEATTARWTGTRWVVTFGGQIATLREGLQMGLRMREGGEGLPDPE
ncbi:MAG: hypothetical protein AAF845_14525 [Bacteroidota bacterium]